MEQAATGRAAGRRRRRALDPRAEHDADEVAVGKLRIDLDERVGERADRDRAIDLREGAELDPLDLLVGEQGFGDSHLELPVAAAEGRAGRYRDVLPIEAQAGRQRPGPALALGG